MPITFDASEGMLVSTVSGMQTEADANAFMDDLMRLIPVAKAQAGRVLHLVDARGATAQSRDSSSVYTSFMDDRGAVVDKVAVIVDSAILKLQSQRLYGTLPVQLFADADDAKAWLREP